MKFIKKLFLILFLLLLLAAGGLFIFIKTFDINKYKPQIITAAESALKRKVDFKDVALELSLAQGIRAVVHDLHIGEDPIFGAGDFASVSEIFLGVDILAYVSREEISLTAIEIRAPSITIIRDKNGIINAQSIAKSSQKTDVPAANTSPAAALPVLFIQRLAIRDGVVTFVDRSQSPEFQTKITKIDVDIEHFSLTDQFPVALKMAALSAEQNIQAKSRVTLDIAKQGAKINDTEFLLDCSKFDWAQIKQLPGAANIPVPQTLQGNLRANLKELSADAAGLSPVLLNIALEKGQVTLRNAAPGVTLDIPVIDAAVTDLSLDGKPFHFKINAAYLSPQPNIAVEGTGALDSANPQPRFSDVVIKADLSSLSFDKLRADIAALKQTPLPDKLAGQFQASVKEFAIGTNSAMTYQAAANFTNGAVSFKQLAPGVALDLHAIDLSLQNISPSTWAKFQVKAAYLNEQPNIYADGNLFLNQASGAVNVREARVATELSSFSLEKLKASIAALKDTPLPEALRGKLNIQIPEAAAGGGAPVTYTANVALDEGYVKVLQLPVPAQNIVSRMRVTPVDLTVDSLTLNLGKGAVKMSAIVNDYPGQKRFSSTIQTAGVEIAEVTDQTQWPIKASGAINMGMALAGAGFDPQILKQNIRGQGTIEILSAKLVKFNVLKLVMDKINIVPGFSQIIQTRLPARWQQKLQQQDTLISKASLQTAVQNGTLTINPAILSAEGFDFHGNGHVGLLDQSYVMDGTFILPQDMAADMAAVVPEMGYLMDETKQIRFPLHVEGKDGSVSFMPDLGNVATTIIQNKGKEELYKVLDKKLGIKLPGMEQPQPQTAPAPSTPGQPAAPEQPLSPEQQLMQGVMDRLLQ